MPRRRSEPDEAIGPSLDGLDQIERLELALRQEPEEVAVAEPEEPEPQEPQTAVICGGGEVAQACARLALDCGFELKYAVTADSPADESIASLANEVVTFEEAGDLVGQCGIDANSYVCIFTASAQECVQLIYQCMHSDAVYIGAWADKSQRREIFAELKADGAPDAELAAICCPMGLGIGAETPAQDAVAIVAEMLAARSGVLKRLRFRA